MESTKQILQRADVVLGHARAALTQLRDGQGPTRITGLHNVAVWGRAFSNVLQNLRSAVPDFDEWYSPFRETMKNDEICQFFYRMRTEMLKEGRSAHSSATQISSFTTNDLSRFHRPAGATAFFMGDETGGSGWIVVLPDGTEEKFYVELPADIGWSDIVLPNLGRPGMEDSKEVRAFPLAARYVTYLEQIQMSARQRFDRLPGAP